MAISIPRAGRIAILGTSLVQQNHNGSDSHIATSARGWMSWAEVLSHGRLACPIHHDPAVVSGWEPSNRPGISRFFTGLNFGVSGQKAIEIERRLARLLAEDFDLIVLDAGTNDMMVETKETIAEIRARIATTLLAAGKTVILLPILARGTQKWASVGAERAKAHWINQMSLDFAARHANCHVFDWNAPWVDTADPDGAPQAGFSNDGTHFPVTGGFAVGKALATYLTPLVPHAAPRLVAPDDRFDAINNPLGNLARAQDQSISATASSNHVLANDVVYPGAGAWVTASCTIAVPAHPAILGLSLVLTDPAEEGLRSISLSPFKSDDGQLWPYPAHAWNGLLRTPPIRLRPGAIPPSLTLEVILATDAAPLHLDIGGIDIRPVPNPVRS
ncbi:SGNH/GDSL hydrolase family protein (plasmid) [Devosia neptuniae]|uniref:SGNH/GDSL hydrolase family protein n=1 Tax=Devosia neptuniae TaxID=191302 RepID=A0ABY6C9V5_9HYPH|nr:SGNH/GDSL hydrolase family protein [Devosia neptuniae]UXN67781.1 SGNH/GDSL hydrolase family protein [Devosia neptuniae]